MTGTRYVRWFDELTLGDVAEVGGKNASLGELYRELTPLGINVPKGFAVTASAYRDTLTRSGAWDVLEGLLSGVDRNDVDDLAQRAREARGLVYESPLSAELREQITQSYQQLVETYGHDMSVAVRSSATAEDLPTASFAGQHETFLNVHGLPTLLRLLVH